MRESPQVPTAVQIAARAGCSARSIYERFADLRNLSLAAADYAVEPGRAEAVALHVDGDRQTRVRAYVATRARTCERWLPLWRVVIANQADLTELKARIDLVRSATVERLKLMYRLELSELSTPDCEKMLITLEAIVDFESWGRMREHHGLSVDAARDVWIAAIDWMLPPTPAVS